MERIKNFLDSDGRIKTWPAKHQNKLLVLQYMGSKFEPGRIYTEREVNHIIEEWHTFGDLFLLRRGMADAGLLKRTADGAQYWREESAGE